MSTISNFFKGFKKGMNDFVENLGAVVNLILLLCVYIFGIGITSILSKLFRKKFFLMGPSRKIGTYWEDFELKNKQAENYYRQY